MKQTLISSRQLPLDHPSELDGTRLNAAFDYLENVAFAATVCDKEGIVLYQNAVARQRMLNTIVDTLKAFMPKEMMGEGILKYGIKL